MIWDDSLCCFCGNFSFLQFLLNGEINFQILKGNVGAKGGVKERVGNIYVHENLPTCSAPYYVWTDGRLQISLGEAAFDDERNRKKSFAVVEQWIFFTQWERIVHIQQREMTWFISLHNLINNKFVQNLSRDIVFNGVE